MHQINITTSKEKEMIDITDKIQKIIDQEKFQDGIAIIFVPHTTAAITINENADINVEKDILKHMQKLVPESREFLHAEGNSDAHILTSLFTSSVQVIVENQKLQLGTWQSIFFCEFDGARERKVWIKLS